MTLNEEQIEAFLEKYVKDDSVLSFGSGAMAETFVKKMALKIETNGLNVKVVPTSTSIATILSEMHVPITSLNDSEIDLAIEFVDSVDRYFNFIKRDSLSLIRDKMIAQLSEELVIVAEEKNYVKSISGIIPLEVAVFGWKNTLIQLQKFGEAILRLKGHLPFKTESNNYLIDLNADKIFSLDELQSSLLLTPGVIETGLFIGYADRLLLHNGKITVKSRMDYSKQNVAEATDMTGLFTI